MRLRRMNMYISYETLEQTNRRLLDVIKRAEMKTFDGSYTFSEFPGSRFPSAVSKDAIALVRDGEVWSQLVPSTDSKVELFKIFCFHFEDGLDNSGFVGWLASHIKVKIGTGLFVICGYNAERGGIFDYWGCPAEVGDKVIEEVQNLKGA